jgi:hypothetical protein
MGASNQRAHSSQDHENPVMLPTRRADDVRADRHIEGALNRHVERVFNPDRKAPQSGWRRLALG